MFSKRNLTMAISVFGIFFAMSIFMSFTTNIAIAQVPDALFDDPVLNGCGDNEDFTTDFLTDRCRFKTIGYNPYFILLPGFQFILEGDGEREVATVLRETKKITLGDRKIRTRVFEERALELNDADEWKTVEIALNWIAICEKTNDVYYFGEDSQDCDLEETGGFDPEDESKCLDGSDPDTGGSWEAGKPLEGLDNPIAQPGILMPGTFLLGAKYFQEVAVNLDDPSESAIDRGEHVAMGEDVVVPAGEWENCVMVIDTNPTEEEDGGCSEEDEKTYCPGIGIVKDKDLELVDYGFVSRRGKLLGKKLKSDF